MKGKKEDSDIIEQAKAGNQEAFSQLHEKYRSDIRKYITSRYHEGKEVNSIEQETWARIKETLIDENSNLEDFHDFAQTWAKKITDLRLIKAYLDGNQKSFEKLYSNYRKTIRGYITSKCFINEDVDHLEQEIWAFITGKFPIYDPQKGSFYTFAKYWAHLWILRYLREILRFPNQEELNNDVPDLKREPPDVIVEREKSYRKFLSLTFSEGGPPHQLITFGFNKLLKAGPKKIAAEYSDIPLTQLHERLIQGYIEESFIPEDEVRACFKSLCCKMDKKVKEVLEKRDSTRKYHRILDKKVGTTCLNAYYGENPEHNVADWSNKVKNRVLKALEKSITPRETKRDERI